ncbi:MAG: hypothetical protein VX382_03455 [Candidatus Thermoplasmatota archaeon]|jgi:hypothetical protein|nr:hypothetical protein [Candidatus Thermoplasmatota archaeon]MEC7505076.1 hypothetical protein [Candidatus Thermoplasmatota archaeon]MEC7507997.1 hypothetical protein [Candidatus Thermoplasmatota archaeon]MEC8577536.1 hypothetical protein [Candidatus Thermoplasmatota archaeon]MEC8816450.1 hypothetical protein [Candidatus Thermoplasmatota archaeon]
MDPGLQRSIAYVVMGVTFLVMAYIMGRRMKANRAAMLKANAPKIAGEDALGGGARNPQQFDEPDEEALEEMANLLGEDDSDDEA